MSSRTPDPRQLSHLLEVSQTLGTTLNLRQALQGVLGILEESHGILSGPIVLRREGTTELQIEATNGAAASARQARYALGEGIVGRVAQTGRPVTVPRVSQEPLFLDRSGVFKRSRRAELSYVCVPIRAEHRTVGALGVALDYQKERHYDHEAKFCPLLPAERLLDLHAAEVSGTLVRQSLAEALDAYEKDLEQDALTSARGNRAKAARLLHTTERILGYAVRKHRLDPDRFR